MKQDTLIQIFYYDDSTGQLDDNGVYIQNEVLLTTSTALILPYSRKLAIDKYGIDVDVNKLIIIDHEISNINIGMLIKDNKGNQYEIKDIPWDLRRLEILAHTKVSVS
ncbi:hypothetical protein [Clostridium sp.]|uniref:hypothetical protein n=1 Tax=Clostridium sp. TaxID=1506 RepID=UPI00261EDD0D|nr:hypothetical protein [Clostridium sp.]